MRVQVTYDEFKAKAAGKDVYYIWDPKAANAESPLFFARAMIAGVVIEFWADAIPATWDVDFPAAISATSMED